MNEEGSTRVPKRFEHKFPSYSEGETVLERE